MTVAIGQSNRSFDTHVTLVKPALAPGGQGILSQLCDSFRDLRGDATSIRVAFSAMDSRATVGLPGTRPEHIPAANWFQRTCQVCPRGAAVTMIVGDRPMEFRSMTEYGSWPTSCSTTPERVAQSRWTRHVAFTNLICFAAEGGTGLHSDVLRTASRFLLAVADHFHGNGNFVRVEGDVVILLRPAEACEHYCRAAVAGQLHTDLDPIRSHVLDTADAANPARRAIVVEPPTSRHRRGNREGHSLAVLDAVNAVAAGGEGENPRANGVPPMSQLAPDECDFGGGKVAGGFTSQDLRILRPLVLAGRTGMPFAEVSKAIRKKADAKDIKATEAALSRLNSRLQTVTQNHPHIELLVATTNGVVVLEQLR